MHTLPHSGPLTLWPATADLHLYQRLLDTHWQVWVSLLWGSLLLSPRSWYTQGFVCALQESVSQVLCKFWQLYGGINGNLLQEGLRHTQVCCTQSPCSCGRPLLTRTPQETLRHSKAGLVLSLWKLLVLLRFCLSPLRISGTHGVWGLILHGILPLVAQLVKNLPAMQETLVQSLGWEYPLEKRTATHSSILAWRVPWTILGVPKSPTWLSNFHFTSELHKMR